MSCRSEDCRHENGCIEEFNAGIGFDDITLSVGVNFRNRSVRILKFSQPVWK